MSLLSSRCWIIHFGANSGIWEGRRELRALGSDPPERDLGNLVSCLLTKGVPVRVGNETEDAGRGGVRGRLVT